MEWEAVIGLEVHLQLKTKAKMFSRAATGYGAEPNTQACAVDLALPGVLPLLNKEAVRMAVKFGASIDADISRLSIFSRKNYFYPDLPKGYQISQFDIPIIRGGKINIQLDDGTRKTINIHEAHLEEDSGKSLHEDFHGSTGIDLNRAGTPLIEIVSEADLRSAEEAVAYLKTLHTLVRYLDISDANMQEGSFRCDANVSVRKKGSEKFGTRTETKNINSFRFVEKAINFEIARQIAVLEGGNKVTQETRLYDASNNETRPLRSKLEANDYRYFPDPDLLPLELTEDFIREVSGSLPELPWEKRDRLEKDYGISAYDANILIANQALADYFETAATLIKDSAKLVANWVIGDLLGALNKNNLTIQNCPISAEQLAELVKFIADGTISGKIAKDVFEAMFNGEGNAAKIIKKKGLQQISDPKKIEKIILKVLKENSEQLANYKAGKNKLFGFFVGQVMQKTSGKANPQLVNDLLKKHLN